jgi:hypothetical protein
MYDKIYYPYLSTDNKHKYLIITDTGKKINFGDIKYEDFTQHKDEERKKAYINRHKKREDWTKSGINTKGWWSRFLLWEEPDINDAYKKINEKLLKWGYYP